MGHKTKIGETFYEIKGGNTKIGLTYYEIKNGKTYVGGASYDVGFLYTFNISYVLNGGSLSGSYPTTYTNQSTTTLPTPSREGHTFAGWYDNPSCTGNPITHIPYDSEGDKTFYAKWNVYYYTVTINRVGQYGQIWINGVQILEPVEASLPYGTIIAFLVTGDARFRSIKLNGNEVGTVVSSNETLYQHTVTSNLSITVTEGYNAGVIEIWTT